MKKGKASEVHAYVHILNELRNKKGWDKGQIFTQQECHQIKPIAETLGGAKPENVVKISEKIYWVIEAKNERIKIEQALKEACEDYAEKINKGSKIRVSFITGIAGNDEEGFICKSQFLKDREWETITENDVEITGLLSKTQIERILEHNEPKLREVEISDAEFLKSAEDINGILHEGGIHKDYRARVMSAILLALSEGTEINLDVGPKLLVDSINSRVDVVLQREGKPDFARFVKIDLPSSTDNHKKFRRAIVLTIQELLGLNIRSAMRSGKDVLGKFYEVFLKYGNGAKEIGIVLTPRHITRFAAEVLDVQPRDLVYDPTCGTGGFLVAAYDEVHKKASEQQFRNFKRFGIYGVEEQDPVVALSIVNMIFRGDGKTNIIEGDCFAKWLNATTKENVACAEYFNEDKSGRIPPITKVLMNPPFPKKKTDYKEYLFVEQALRQMQNGGLLFSVLQYSVLIKGGGYLNWRKNTLLKKNTLVAVITFPSDLFYPIGVHSVGVFIKKGIPHPEGQNVLWIRAIRDGFRKSKGRRFFNKDEPNDLNRSNALLKAFLQNQAYPVRNIPRLQKASPINFTDKMLELVPEAHLDGMSPSIEEIQRGADKLIRESVAFLIANKNEVIFDEKA